MNKTKIALISVIFIVVSIGIASRLIFPKAGAQSNGPTFAEAIPTAIRTAIPGELVKQVARFGTLGC